ncbi:MAG: hypothetical protein J1E38_08755 [Paramuribaculum sp.]|nr:hypothetical protein [Paramuribaculum sp.]
MKTITYQPKKEQDLDDKFVNLYGSRYVGLLSRFQQIMQPNQFIGASLPLLLWLDDEHRNVLNKRYRIMIFGRETNNWNSPNITTYNFNISSSDDITDQVNAIQDIYNAYCYFNDSTKSRFTKNGPMLFENTFRELIPNESACFIWNNICKIGRGNVGTGHACGLAPYTIHKAEQEQFDVVPSEIEIIRPNIVVFLTGSQGDSFIKEKFPNAEFISMPGNSFVDRVSLPEQESVKYAYRVNMHPSARIASLREKLENVYRFIIGDFMDNI